MIVGMLRYRIFCKCMNINVKDHCILTNIKYHILQILVLAILRLLHECVVSVHTSRHCSADTSKFRQILYIKFMSLLYETSKANSRAHCFSCLRYISISYGIYFGMFCFENGTNDAPEE